MKPFRRPFFRLLATLAIALLTGLCSAGPITNYGENKIVDAVVRGQAIGTPATWY